MTNVKSLFRRKDVKETGWSVLTKGSTFFFFYCITFLLSTNLGKESFGEWQTLFSLGMVLSTVSYLGLHQSTKKFVAQYTYSSGLLSVFVHSLTLRILETIGVLAILYLLLPSVLSWVSLQDFPEASVWLLLFVGAMSLSSHFKNIFEGLHRIQCNFWINVSEYGSRVLFIVFLALTNSLSLVTIIQAFAFSVVIGALCGLSMFFITYVRTSRVYPSETVIFPNQTFLKHLFLYSLPLFIISIGFILMAEIDVLMLQILTNSKEVGAYGLAKQLVVKLPQISLALAGGTLPIFARMTEENRSELRAYLIKLLKIVNSIYLPLTLGFLLFSPLLLPVIFGSEYEEAIIPTQILSVWFLIAANSIFFNQVLDYNGKAYVRSVGMAITLVSNIGLNALFIPLWGGVGAALATVFSLFPSVGLNLWLTYHLFSSQKNKAS